MTSSSLCH